MLGASVRSPAPSASISSANRTPSPLGVGQVAGGRATHREGPVERERDRAHPQLVAVLALDDLGQGADRRGAAALEGGQDSAFGRRPSRASARRRGHRARRPGRRRHGTRRPALPGRARAASARGRAPPWPRRGGRFGPGRRGPGRRASSSPSRTLPIRVSMLPRTPTTSKPRPRAWSWAARRGEPVPTRLPTGSSPRVSPSRATTTSRGSSRVGTAASAMPSAGWVGRSFSEWTATSTEPSSRAVAQRADEDAGGARAGERCPAGLAAVTVGDHLDQLGLPAEEVTNQGGHVAGLGGGEQAGAGADLDRRRHDSTSSTSSAGTSAPGRLAASSR